MHRFWNQVNFSKYNAPFELPFASEIWLLNLQNTTCLCEKEASSPEVTFRFQVLVGVTIVRPIDRPGYPPGNRFLEFLFFVELRQCLRTASK